MKLTNILLEEEEEGGWEDVGLFSTKKIEKNPETGSETWDVKYNTRTNVNRGVNDLITEFKRLIKENPKDPKLVELLEYLLHFKKIYKMYMSKKYGKFS